MSAFRGNRSDDSSRETGLAAAQAAKQCQKGALVQECTDEPAEILGPVS
jgi:hypothetical protein